jgi:hypothetical protein
LVLDDRQRRVVRHTGLGEIAVRRLPARIVNNSATASYFAGVVTPPRRRSAPMMVVAPDQSPRLATPPMTLIGSTSGRHLRRRRVRFRAPARAST